MPYIIDGHNLIGKLPDMRLSDLDDENELIKRLQNFAAANHVEIEVYFDGAPAGMPSQARFGSVKAYYIRRGITADTAIKHRLDQLKKQAKNWTVVSSDLSVFNYAKSSSAKVMKSEEFAGRLISKKRSKRKPSRDRAANIRLSSSEIDEWMRLFTEDRDENGGNFNK